MRPNRIGLGDHADRPLVGRHIDALARSEYRMAGDADLSAIRALQPPDAAQRRSLAATTRPKTGATRSLATLQRDAVDRVNALLVLAETFLQSFDLYRFSSFRHLSSERLGYTHA